MKNYQKKFLQFGKSLVFLLLLAVPQKAFAVVLGGQLYSTGGNVEVEILPASAGFTSELWLFSPDPDTFIALNHDPVGTIVNLGSFPSGEELIFGIYVRNTGYTFYMGPASRNPDNLLHAGLDVLGPGVANVGFEDLYGGGDLDYDDNVFQFRGGIADTPNGRTIPEPSSLLLAGLGLTTLARRKKFLCS